MSLCCARNKLWSLWCYDEAVKTEVFSMFRNEFSIWLPFTVNEQSCSDLHNYHTMKCHTVRSSSFQIQTGTFDDFESAAFWSNVVEGNTCSPHCCSPSHSSTLSLSCFLLQYTPDGGYFWRAYYVAIPMVMLKKAFAVNNTETWHTIPNWAVEAQLYPLPL